MGIRPFADGTLDKLKALLVVKGYLQEEEVDCEETFAPTTKYTSIQCGLQLAAHNNCYIFQMDVNFAFLNGGSMEEVYVEQPPCFDISGQEGMVYRMKKASYGFKQVPKAWYKKVYSFFISCMRTIFC